MTYQPSKKGRKLLQKYAQHVVSLVAVTSVLSDVDMLPPLVVPERPGQHEDVILDAMAQKVHEALTAKMDAEVMDSLARPHIRRHPLNVEAIVSSMARQIQESEDRAIFSALAAIQPDPPPPPPAPITRETMAATLAELDRYRLQPDRIIMDSATAERLRRWAQPGPRQEFSMGTMVTSAPIRGRTMDMVVIDDLAHFREDVRFMEMSYVTNPPDPHAVIRDVRVFAAPAPEAMDRVQIGREVTPAYLAQRVVVPEFELASNPTLQIDDIRQRRFDLIDRDEELRETQRRVAERARRFLDAVVDQVLARRQPPPTTSTRPAPWEEDDAV